MASFGDVVACVQQQPNASKLEGVKTGVVLQVEESKQKVEVWQQQLDHQQGLVRQEITHGHTLLQASISDCKKNAYSLRMWLKEPWKEPENDLMLLQAAQAQLQQAKAAAIHCQARVDKLTETSEVKTEPADVPSIADDGIQDPPAGLGPVHPSDVIDLTSNQDR